ncbi:PucR family transcriptional regulator [Pseudarthrobacter sp. J64]|uniref:PucR family transcriptional regulator n=1 Tax=Pseudarthrobacter sp. J64 TaxID=3116485 RepID=UPI002E8207AF|nr:PucR family transcriptional regulator [Pseudarthrobacter sp. J64]MEE2570734.1 PucR family transcriptional regulator [Pseudarthrobacter sp. J64]
MSQNAPAGDTTTTQLDPVTLGQFLGALPKGLSVLVDAGNGDAPLRWVEPSELEDPTPYLLDGEFVLTAGLPFLEAGSTADATDTANAYVKRLVDAQVAALGFGLEPYFDDVPEPLVSACRTHGLTLVRIPSSVPFAALGLAFSQLLESGNARVFRQLAETNRQLMRAVLSARPEHELLSALAQRVPVWALLIGSDGRVRARAAATTTGTATVAPATAGSGTRGGSGVELSALQPLLKRLLTGNGPRVETESFDVPGSALVYGHPLRSAKDATLGRLVLGTGKPLTPAQNSVVSSVVGLLELLVRQRTSGSLAPSQLATALLLHPETLATGGTRELNILKDLLAQSVSGTRSGAVRVVQGIRVDEPGKAAADGPVRELLQWRRLFDTKMVELTDYGFAAVTRLKVDDALLQEVEDLGWRLVVGEATELSGLPAAYKRATSLRGRVQTAGRSVRVDEVTWSVTGLLGREAGVMLAARLLEPVLSQDAERRAAQLNVLTSWLRENGNWDATAKALGLHRNSVRRQITALAELLEMDLGQAQVRAELWIALQYVDGIEDLQESQDR